MAYWYRVQTICAATIREAWTIRSDAPLTRAAIEAVIKQQQAAPSVSCVEEETRVEEAERVVFNVVSLEVEGSATQRRH